MRRVFAMRRLSGRAAREEPGLPHAARGIRNSTGHPTSRVDYRSAAHRSEPSLCRLGFHVVPDRPAAARGLRLQIPHPCAGEDAPAFEGVLGAAWLTLGDARLASIFRARPERNPDDYLWLLNYADALEQNTSPTGVACAAPRVDQGSPGDGESQGEKPSLDLIQATHVSRYSRPG